MKEEEILANGRTSARRLQLRMCMPRPQTNARRTPGCGQSPSFCFTCQKVIGKQKKGLRMWT